MFSEPGKKNPNPYVRIATGAFLVGLGYASGVAYAATLSELITKAKEERALNATVTDGTTGRTIPKLVSAFKKRFGLDINATVVAVSDVAHTAKAIAETRAGAPPTYDAIEGADTNKFTLVEVGAVEKIDGWENLLAEIHPLVRSGKVRPEQISPRPLSGYGFMYASRVKALLYNPRLISKGDLPRTHAELGDPKYTGRWSQPPWTSHWDIGLLAFPEVSKENWLEVIRKAGRNAGAVQPEQAGG